MEKDNSEIWGLTVLLLLLGLAIYLLIKYPFAVIVLLIPLVALWGAFTVKDVGWSWLLKFVSGLFALFFVLHLIKLSDDAIEKSKPEFSRKELTEEERGKQAMCDAGNGPVRAALNCR